jgi:hypothetical protein
MGRLRHVVGRGIVIGVVGGGLLLVPPVEATCKRSAATVRLFQRITGYPLGRPGYVVDHVIPLACGGPDTVGNMQWQDLAAAKAKDRIERRYCAGCKGQ